MNQESRRLIMLSRFIDQAEHVTSLSNCHLFHDVRFASDALFITYDRNGLPVFRLTPGQLVIDPDELVAAIAYTSSHSAHAVRPLKTFPPLATVQQLIACDDLGDYPDAVPTSVRFEEYGTSPFDSSFTVHDIYGVCMIPVDLVLS